MYADDADIGQIGADFLMLAAKIRVRIRVNPRTIFYALVRADSIARPVVMI
jgi:hypothetical protein